jgi:hypothetical protein
VFPCFALGQKKGFIDNLGRKQGVFNDYTGSLLIDRTYKNDTLNGVYREYSIEGTTWETGYYKNGLKDSLWLEFYKNGTVKERTFYRQGMKDGECINYFENGHISYNALFRNDTVVGDEINFYETGTIESKGNKQNGTWTDYYQNGNIKSQQQFSNGTLLGHRYVFSENGDTILPRFIAQRPISVDSSIINNTDLKVYLLFEQSSRIFNTNYLGPYLFYEILICKNDFLTIRIGFTNFLLKSTGLLVFQKIDSSCNQRMGANNFTTNLRVIEKKNGTIDISYVLEKKYFNARLGKIEVNREQMRCDDTGNNPVTIIRNGKKLIFKDIGNVLFFEYDIDNDNKTELYLVNYYCCLGRLEIYKIDDK